MDPAFELVLRALSIERAKRGLVYVHRPDIVYSNFTVRTNNAHENVI